MIKYIKIIKDFFKNKTTKIVLSIIGLIVLIILVLDYYVILSIRSRIINFEDYKKIGYTQCIIVMGLE